MNASSMAGRLSPGFFAHSLGVVQMTVASTFCSGVLVFSMVSIGSVTSFVVIAVLYGYAVGICKYQNYIFCIFSLASRSDMALEGPLIAFLTPDISELG